MKKTPVIIHQTALIIGFIGGVFINEALSRGAVGMLILAALLTSLAYMHTVRTLATHKALQDYAKDEVEKQIEEMSIKVKNAIEENNRILGNEGK